MNKGCKKLGKVPTKFCVAKICCKSGFFLMYYSSTFLSINFSIFQKLKIGDLQNWAFFDFCVSWHSHQHVVVCKIFIFFFCFCLVVVFTYFFTVIN